MHPLPYQLTLFLRLSWPAIQPTLSKNALLYS
jgi:hypothetical protein